MGGWRLVRLFDTEIRVHYSWFFIAFLIFMSLEAHFHQTFPGWSFPIVWLAAGVTAFLLFASIIVHELSHALVGRSYGLSISSITLFVFGGVANLEGEPQEPKAEFWVAIVGPLTSAAIGLLCLGLAGVSWGEALPGEVLGAVLRWIGQINLALAIFNFIPAFPMDGGRVLRAVLWWWTGNSRRAYFWAALTGRIFALGLAGLGLFQVYKLGNFGGLWLAVIGWFIFRAAPLRLPERGNENNNLQDN